MMMKYQGNKKIEKNIIKKGKEKKGKIYIQGNLFVICSSKENK